MPKEAASPMGAAVEIFDEGGNLPRDVDDEPNPVAADANLMTVHATGSSQPLTTVNATVVGQVLATVNPDVIEDAETDLVLTTVSESSFLGDVGGRHPAAEPTSGVVGGGHPAAATTVSAPKIAVSYTHLTLPTICSV